MERLATEFAFGRADAEAWISAWEREAAVRGLPSADADYWPAGEMWIAMRRAQVRRPPGGQEPDGSTIGPAAPVRA